MAAGAHPCIRPPHLHDHILVEMRPLPRARRFFVWPWFSRCIRQRNRWWTRLSLRFIVSSDFWKEEAFWDGMRIYIYKRNKRIELRSLVKVPLTFLWCLDWSLRVIEKTRNSKIFAKISSDRSLHRNNSPLLHATLCAIFALSTTLLFLSYIHTYTFRQLLIPQSWKKLWTGSGAYGGIPWQKFRGRVSTAL